MRRHGRRVPLPDIELGSRRVLVMEYGGRLVTDVQTQRAAQRQGYSGCAPPGSGCRRRLAPRRRRLHARGAAAVGAAGGRGGCNSSSTSTATRCSSTASSAPTAPGQRAADRREIGIDRLRPGDAAGRRAAADAHGLLVALAAQDEAAAVAGAAAGFGRDGWTRPSSPLAAFFFDRDDYDQFGVEDGGGGGGPVVAYSPARTLKTATSTSWWWCPRSTSWPRASRCCSAARAS